MNNQKILKIVLIILAVSIAFGFRWYRLPEHLFFGFEQGRDAEQARALYQFQDLYLVGPKTDIAGIFHGAWFYYLLGIVYFVGQGHPLAGSFALVVVSSLVPVGVYYLISSWLKSKGWGIVGAFLAIVSFDLITYSRWLSNVSWAVPLVLLHLILLQKYVTTKKPWFFVTALAVAAMAAQFQIMLSLWLFFFMIVLYLANVLPLPTRKYLLFSVASVVLIYGPLIIFNSKYSFLSLSSAREYILESAATPVSLRGAFSGYGTQLLRLYKRSIVDVPHPFLAIWIGVQIVGLMKAALYAKNRPGLILFLSLSGMTLPVLLFAKSLNLEQLYVASSLGFIGLFVMSMWGWWRIFLGKVVVFFCLLVIIANTALTFQKIKTNSGFYFITIQEGLELQYQKQVLEYIKSNEDGNQTYFLKAFTIPYYQEQGWQYLRSYYLADLPFDPGADTIYVVIEAQVDPYWEQQWLRDLGKTTVVETKEFGLLRVLKLERVKTEV